MPFWPIFCNFWCPVVPLVTFSSNLSNFERNPKNKNKKIQKKNKKKYRKVKKTKKNGKKSRKSEEKIQKSIINSKNQKLSKVVKKSKNHKKSQKLTFSFFFNFFLSKKSYPLSFPILGGHDSTRAFQSSLFQKYKNLKISNHFFVKKKKKIKKLSEKKKKKCYPFSFPILGGRDSTRALQSTPFQNPRGGPLSVTQQQGVAGRFFFFLILDASFQTDIIVFTTM